MKFFNLRAAFLAVLGGSLCIAVVAQNGSTGDKGFDISRMDNKTMACDNFYEYANGTWLKNTVVPAAFPTWGSFDILSENNRKTLHDILEDASKNRTVAAGTNEQKIGDFYATCMATASREAAGAKPLTP